MDTVDFSFLRTIGKGMAWTILFLLVFLLFVLFS